MTLIAPRNLCWSGWVLISLYRITDGSLLQGWICTTSVYPHYYWICADSKTPVQPWLGLLYPAPQILPSSLVPHKIQWYRRWRTCRLLSTHFCNAFHFFVVIFFFVCWLIVLVLLSWFGFNFPFRVSIQSHKTSHSVSGGRVFPEYCSHWVKFCLHGGKAPACFGGARF